MLALRAQEMRRAASVVVILTLAATVFGGGCAERRVQRFDVVVYGGTAAGAVAAVAAAQEGATVALLEPGGHIGGMVSGGLGKTDHGNKAVIGGMSREFFDRVGKHYGEPVTWYFEPHVAEQVFRDWLREANVAVFLDHRLEEAKKDGRRIAGIRTANGRVFAAKVFIDAGYEGDLMARAGVPYAVDREGRERYGESLAGVQEHSRFHQFAAPVNGRDEAGRLLPGVYAGERGAPGAGDSKVQAYNFRVCLCNRKDNQVPFPRPANYDPARYEILRRYLAARGEGVKFGDVAIVSLMPNGKTDVNNRGPISTDHIGANWDYPEASYERRQAIRADHVSYVQGFFYFLANDPSVPKPLRDEVNQWGLAKDEFADTGHWPHQMYVREARRMVGERVMTQRDVQEERTKPDSIGMGSFQIDSHHVQRVVRPDGTLENEGDVQVAIQPYEIPYRCLLPKGAECENLLVPVCLSASHVAYSTLRMEPQYMILGQAAGHAAADAAKQDAAVQSVDIERLRARLRERGQVLSLASAPAPHVGVKSLEGIVVDNSDAQLTDSWTPSVVVAPFVGADYVNADGRAGTKGTARFTPTLPKAGVYEVRVAYGAYSNRATNVTVRINTADGVKTMALNQRRQPASPPFESLGRFRLAAGRDGWVELDASGADGYVVADAVQWIVRGEP